MKTPKLLLVLLSALLIAGCVPPKKLLIVQDELATDTLVSAYAYQKKISMIEPDDELFLRVSSITTTDLYNYDFFNSGNTGSRIYSGSDYTLLSYTVDYQGKIKLPQLGFVKVGGLTLQQASDSIQTKLANYLNQPSVTLKFVNKSVSVLGDVNRPGTFAMSKEDENVLHAIAMAGDFAPFANRSNVLLIRKTDTELLRVRLDLSKSSIFTSPYYFLKDDDILFVELLKRKVMGLQTFPFSLILSTLTTGLLVVSFIQKQ